LKDSASIDVVLSDIVMQGMNGFELARIIRERHPKIGVVLATGYSDKAAAALAEGFPLLQKPYTRDSLRAALAQVSVGPEAAA